MSQDLGGMQRLLLDKIEKQVPHMMEGTSLVNNSTILKNEIKSITAWEELTLAHYTAANLGEMVGSIAMNVA